MTLFLSRPASAGRARHAARGLLSVPSAHQPTVLDHASTLTALANTSLILRSVAAKDLCSIARLAGTRNRTEILHSLSRVQGDGAPR